MSARTDFDYLHDMLQYAEDAHAMAAGRSEADLDTDSSFRYALQYCLLIIGEAASHVSDSTRTRLVGIPWTEIVGMRNWLAHGYFKIRSETVWKTATLDLPRLIDEILAFLPPEQT